MSKGSRRSYTLSYSSIQAVYWMSYAVLSAYASYYLLQIGISNTVIGTLLAATGLIASLIQPILASWADGASSPPLRKILAVQGVVMAASCTGVLLTGRAMPVPCCGFYALSMILLHTMLPIVNALGVETLNQRKSIVYGVTRAAGSAGYGAMAYGMGLATARIQNPVLVPAVAIAIYAVFAVISFVYPLDKGAADDTERAESAQNSTILEFFRKYPRFMIMLMGCVLVYLSHALLNTYMLQIITTRGGNTSQMGLATMIAALVELIPMLLYPVLSRRVRYDWLLRISGIAFFLKNLCTWLSGNLAAFYGAQLIQLAAWGIMAMFLVVYVNRIVSREDLVKGQAFAAAANTLGAAIGALSGGWLLDAAGVNSMLLFGTVCAAIGAVIIFFAAQKTSADDSVQEA